MAIQSIAQRVLLFCVTLISASAVIATPTYVYDGTGTVVTGIDNIEVGSSLWDVDFIDDSVDDYLAVTGLSGPQFNISQQNLVIDLHNALSLALTDDLADLLPTAFNGCTTTATNCDLITLLTINPFTTTDPGSSNGIKTTVQGTNVYPLGFAEINDNSVNAAFNTLTFWTEQSTSAPEPSVLALLSTGLFGLFGLSRLRARS